MIAQLRIFVPETLSDAVVDCSTGELGVAEVSRQRGASVVPPGDVIHVLLARESVEGLVEKLHALNVQEKGSISVTMPELVLSDRADKATADAPGEGADAVIWDEVSRQTGEDSRLTWSYLAFLILATQLAAIGIVTDSTIAIVGAMAVGPEFGPLAALAVALVRRQWKLGRSAALALGVDFPWRCWCGLHGVALRAAGPLPRRCPGQRFSRRFHLPPGSVFADCRCAGRDRRNAVRDQPALRCPGRRLHSVTTVPAAGFVAVALVLGEFEKAAGSALQLALNLVGIVAAAVAVLVFYRLITKRLPDAAALRLKRKALRAHG